MVTVANQDIVQVDKEPCDDRGNTYAKININAIKLAMKDLTPAQFEVWLYFAENQQGFTFAVSPAAALDSHGIKKDTFQTAKRVFKEKGYLIPDPSKKGNNYWIFREIPADKEEIMYVTKM